MSDQEPDRVFFRSGKSQDTDENRVMGSTDYYDIHLNIPDDQLRLLWPQNAPFFPNISTAPPAGCSYMTLYDLSNISSSSSLPSQQVKSPREIPCFSGLEVGQSSGTKRKHPSEYCLDMQTRDQSVHEEVEGEDTKRWDECKQQKRTRYSEVHKLNEKLRRKKLNEKIKSLKELIPKCHKRDKVSIVDDAIQYIKTLQYQVQEHQIMSRGAGFSTFHSPFMMPQPVQQGMQIPSLLPFPYSCSRPGIGLGYGGMGMGMSGMSSSFNFPMSQLGLSRPCLLASGSGLAAPDGTSQAQNPWNFLELLNSTNRALCYGSGFPFSGSPCLTQGETSSSQGAHTSKQSKSEGSTTRELPSQIILPQVIEEVKEHNSRHSGSI